MRRHGGRPGRRVRLRRRGPWRPGPCPDRRFRHDRRRPPRDRAAPRRGGPGAGRPALAEAGAAARDVGYVAAYGTSASLDDRVEARTLRRVLPDAPPVSSPKGVTGHLLGAAGAVEAACTVLAVQHGVVPPTANLVTPNPEIGLRLPAAQTSRAIGGSARGHAA